MARMPNIEKLSYAELIELRSEVDALIVTKQGEEKAALKEKLSELAKEKGFDLAEILGNGKGRRGMKVAVKYRDPNNPENTWTGRGRMPLWLVEAIKKRGVKRENFEV